MILFFLTFMDYHHYYTREKKTVISTQWVYNILINQLKPGEKGKKFGDHEFNNF